VHVGVASQALVYCNGSTAHRVDMKRLALRVLSCFCVCERTMRWHHQPRGVKCQVSACQTSSVSRREHCIATLLVACSLSPYPTSNILLTQRGYCCKNAEPRPEAAHLRGRGWVDPAAIAAAQPPTGNAASYQGRLQGQCRAAAQGSPR
jgi:hypothetical protein